MRFWSFIIPVVILAAVGAWALFGRGGATGALNTDSTYTVTRGDLRISVIEKGNLKAQKSVNIENKVEGMSTIVFLIPEGTFVKEGEILVELDSAELEERATQQEISYETAKAAWIAAKENLEIQRNQNESDVNAGELNKEFAEKELEKYLEVDGDWHLQLEALKNAITIAEEELKRAQNRVDWTQRLHDRGFVTREELEADQLALKKREIELEQAKKQKKLAEAYDYPMQKRKLEADLVEAGLELERIKRGAASQLASKEADLRSREAQYLLQKERFEKLKEQLTNCTIKAPQDGMVVYGSQDDGGRHRYGGDSDDMIEEGASVRYRQTLITLPDVSVMMVDTDVHESAVDKVGVGMDAIVTVDAFPDRRFRGTVSKVAILPDSQSRWLNPDLKVYSTQVILNEKDEKLKPGMSAMVEIIVDELEDMVHTPIQSVFRRGNREVCYVARPDGAVEVRPVRVGLNNEQFVAVLDGVDEGEEVLLHEPPVGQNLDGDVLGDEPEESGPRDIQLERDRDEKPGRERGGSRSLAGQEGDGDRSGGERRGGRVIPSDAPPEARKMMERWSSMTPEERKEAMEKMRQEGGGPPGSFGGRRGRGSGLSDAEKSEMEKWRNMSPEERKAALDKLKEEGKVPESFKASGRKPEGEDRKQGGGE